MHFMSQVPPYIAALRSYIPGKPIAELQRETGAARIIKLASNENPLGPSPKVKEAIGNALDDIHRYPDGGFALTRALAARYRVTPDNIVLGAGSDSLMLALVRAFVTEGGEVVASAGSFAQYYLMPQSRGAIVKTAPLKEYRYDLAAIAALVTPKTQMIFLANPNNPTGTMFTKAEWEAFYRQIPAETLIVLDEAYFEFVETNPDWPDSQKYRYDNVVTLRTFSKTYGLAGLRLGYGIGQTDPIREMKKVKLPFEPNVLALVAGEAALGDREFVDRYRSLVEEGRAVFYERLARMGVRYVPSAANFVMAVFPDQTTAETIHKGLLARGVIVRSLHAFGLPEAIRITIGLPEENVQCMDAIAALV
ncbi:MAG: histidinol-phosphate transaminase [Deltaproteobacteria bacterium]|nr:histidinol-phosphate transaminase [Deltaproteobacteria bacterium]